MSDERYLDDVELLAIARVDHEEDLARLRLEVAEKTLAVEALKQQNLEWQYKLSKKLIAEKTEAVAEKKEDIEKRQEKRRNLLKEIALKYNLDGVWGYDPETGLIHTNSEE